MLKTRLDRANAADAKKELAALLLSVLDLVKDSSPNTFVQEMSNRMAPNLIQQARGAKVDADDAVQLLLEACQTQEEREFELPTPSLDIPIERPSWWTPHVSSHSIERFQIHVPTAGKDDLLWDLAGGVLLDHRIALPLIGRVHDKSPDDLYILGRMRTGMHVLAPLRNTKNYRHCTYLRLERTRVQFAIEHWPPNEAITKI